MKPLTPEDQDRLEDVEQRIRNAAAQLGYCREQYLRREEVLLAALTTLRGERTQMLGVLGRAYLKDEDPKEWQYNADTKVFERITD